MRVDVDVADGAVRLVTSEDPDVVLLEVPRPCVALTPDALEALREAVTAHLAEFYERQPPTWADMETEEWA